MSSVTAMAPQQIASGPSTALPGTPLQQPNAECAVVVVTYQSSRHLPELLAGLAEAGKRRAIHVLVADNASMDGSVEIAEKAGAQVLRTGANLGYAGGLNVAFRHIAPDKPVLILNPDLSIAPDAVPLLLDALQGPGVGIAVPAVRDKDGNVTQSLRNEPSIGRALVDALLGRLAARLPVWASEVVWDRAAYGRPQSPDWACGAALLISPECRQAVGDWDDTRFFLYSEETDFFRRARMAGFTTRFVPGAEVRHIGGGSGQSPALTALMAINRVRYFEKYHGRTASVFFRVAVALHGVVRCQDAGQRLAIRSLMRRSRWDEPTVAILDKHRRASFDTAPPEEQCA